MKFLEKLALIIFSLIISICAIVLILIMLNVLPVSIVTSSITTVLQDDLLFKITMGSTIVALLLALKCIFFGSKKEDDGRNGIVLENTAGKLVISKESLENLVADVVKEVQGIQAISSRTYLDRNNNLIVYVTTLVSKDMMIKDVSAKIQDRIKEALNKTADLEVKQVNIKVKNITSKKIKGLPEGTEEEKNEENIENNIEVMDNNQDTNMEEIENKEANKI